MSSFPQKFTRDVLFSDVGISFWGGIDESTGIITDQTHPLHGECITDKILCIPSGRGSCTGSQVMLELILNGKGPKAVILRDADSILCTGAVIAEEFFKDEYPSMVIPIFCAVGEEKFIELGKSSLKSLTIQATEKRENGNCVIQHKGDSEDIISSNLLGLKDTLKLDEGCIGKIQQSEAASLALRTVRRIASISAATKLIPITCAHIDAVTFIGQGGLKFAQKLSLLGGKVAVPTTLNSQSVDRRRWKELGVDSSLASNANAVGSAYLELGCETSFTCAPYLLPTRPSFGDNIMWGESNAVVYSNSAIGARTEKYADYFDICAAIIGMVPNCGVHLDEHRIPTIVIDATKLIEDHILKAMSNNSKRIEDPLSAQASYTFDIELFFPAMGWLCGNLSDGRIPIILGFDTLPAVSEDNLKAFCAAFGTTGVAPLFHMANITPEAIGHEVIQNFLSSCEDRQVVVKVEDLRNSYETLDGGKDETSKVDVVALGNPHLSLTELKRLSELVCADNRPKKDDVNVIATLGRHIQSKGDELGYTQKLQHFGIQFINDTCWCMLMDPPIIPSDANSRILTNSGKYAHYGPALTNRRLRFGSMHDCIEAAKSGRMKSSPQWLRSFSTRKLLQVAKTAF